MTHESVSIIEDYYRALTARAPAQSFAEFFHLPVALIVGDRKITLNTNRDVETVYDGLLSRYASEGVARIVWEPQATTVVEIYPGLVLAKTMPSRLTADDKLVKTWVCSYLMRELGGKWKCDLVTATPN